MQLSRYGLLAMGCLLTTAPMRAQLDALHAAGPLPAFEVATIKPKDPDKGMRITIPGLNVSGTDGGTALTLIREAYDVRSSLDGPDRIVGGPAWVKQNQYVVTTKIAGDVFEAMQKQTADERKKQYALMMQTLLTERFKLQVHFEKREVSIYELVEAKGGANLPPTTETNAIVAYNGASSMEIDPEKGVVKGGGKDVTLDGFAIGLQTAMQRPVVNKTGIPGRFDIPLKFSMDGTAFSRFIKDANQPIDAPSLRDALKAYGLELQAGKGMEEIVMIDSIAEPTEN